MAEVFGVVAGGVSLVSLAIQLAENAEKIRKLYHNYRDAPQFLQDVSFKLETFKLMLHTVERDRQTQNLVDREIVERCVHMCDQASKDIQEVVTKLETSISLSARRGRLRAAVAHSDMRDRQSELDRALNSLAFAYQLYTA